MRVACVSHMQLLRAKLIRIKVLLSIVAELQFGKLSHTHFAVLIRNADAGSHRYSFQKCYCGKAVQSEVGPWD